MSETLPALFTPLALRGVTARNRTMLSAMNQHVAKDGFADDGLLVHLGKFALGGFGIVTTEATAITPEGRIAPGDLGIWSDDHIDGLRRVTGFLRSAGALAAIQLGHSGRKGSSRRPWDGGPLTDADARNGEPPWAVVSPTAEALGPGHAVPRALGPDGIAAVLEAYATAAARADAAGFDLVEIHGGHGYLIASFLSPVINTRNDAYGGDLAGRMRFALEVAQAVRGRWPAHKPLMFRISSVDGHPQGWQIEDSVILARELKARGVDVIDCSSGGLRESTAIENTNRQLGYQVPYARAIRQGAGIATAAVGLILDAHQAEAVLGAGDADLVALARQALYDPYWPRHAAQALGLDPAFESWPTNAGWWLAKRATGLARIGYGPTGAPVTGG
ncbi:NADH:flavin oxidoreductase/NADH oxidase [Xanthobacter tagetidis]|uniref:NADH:flavin oxidoreductase/NADH oxidase n=1 Tax=Xanthobacter tagetidis TaxID=60216 RepID=A0A3L7A3Q2_9HYPH|nr:NADH:flavin oxidoreductase/NADH oxidase [Xanthobacter tagetidis]MBB6309209.1 2,4-dienoyl-CoA reductase-like NADH-dependent reductase (Old Yellow Enzyme family) [Xanthobacter tagetidis]RLP74171.1 NADH:flavin oxidoreductase/NADH oxidase [Xanthobacter tagetidis]